MADNKSEISINITPHEKPPSQSGRMVSVMAFPFKPSRLNGLSRELLVSHYENNYGGALRRLNALEMELADLDFLKTSNFTINGLKREALIASNSVILHEIYIDNLGGSDDPQGDIAAALERDFGSVATWRSEFVAMGKALAGGAGWVLMTYCPRFQRLINQWAADHTNCVAGAIPILALDMYEHAYHIDFGANASAYVDAFMKNIHWGRVVDRYRSALRGFQRPDSPTASTDIPSIGVEELRSILESKQEVLVLDVRLQDDFAVGKDMIASAHHRDPERFEEWKGEMPAKRPIFVYCAYGFEVSENIASSLIRSSFDARIVKGGIAAWHAIDGPTGPK